MESNNYQENILHGLEPEDFKDIDKTTMNKFKFLLAMVSEHSFRRGYQHGIHACHEQADIDFLDNISHQLRHKYPSFYSPDPDNYNPKRSLFMSVKDINERLEENYPSIKNIGL